MYAALAPQCIHRAVYMLIQILLYNIPPKNVIGDFNNLCAWQKKRRGKRAKMEVTMEKRI